MAAKKKPSEVCTLVYAEEELEAYRSMAQYYTLKRQKVLLQLEHLELKIEYEKKRNALLDAQTVDWSNTSEFNTDAD